jgi:hypothetical protein
MPPLRIFKFKHKLSDSISPITISTYGDIDEAWGILSNYILFINDWELIKN